MTLHTGTPWGVREFDCVRFTDEKASDVAEPASADATLAFTAGRRQFRSACHSYYMSDAKSLIKVEGLSS